MIQVKSLKTKLMVLILGLALAPLIVQGGFTMWRSTVNLKKQAMIQMTQLVDLASHMAQVEVDELVEEGKIDDVSAQEHVKEELYSAFSRLEMGEGSYLFAVSVGPNDMGEAVVHPTLAGKSVLEIKDRFWRDILSQKSGELRIKDKNGSYQIVRFHHNEALQWIIGGVIDESQLLSGVTKTRQGIIMVFILTLLIASGLGYFLVDYVTGPIFNLKEKMTILEGGDLTVSIDISTDDELGDLERHFNFMVKSFQKMVSETVGAVQTLKYTSSNIASSADETGQASGKIALSIEEVASTAARQGKQIAQVSRKIFELSNDCRNVSKVALSGVEKTAEIAQTVQAGVASINDVVSSMGRIKRNSDDAGTIMRTLDAGSQKIGNIVATISTIAAQTNLLALNAAIEAARAGEQGRGFAVVADEVRKLAESSASAADEIKDLIGDIQSSTSTAVELISQGNEEVRAGVEVVNQAGGEMRNISSVLEEVSILVKDISEKTADQSIKSREFVKEVDSVALLATQTTQKTHEVAAATQQTSASVEEVTASVVEVAALAEQLNKLVVRFKLEDLEADSVVTGLIEKTD